MRYAIQRYVGSAAVMVMVSCFGGVACESEPLPDPASEAALPAAAAAAEARLNAPAAPMNAEKRAAFERESSKMRCQEGTSPSELGVRWDKTPEGSQTELKAILKNNASVSITAEPVLMAANATLGEARERRLAPITLGPGAETTLAVDVADFPLQSLGESTSVSVGLRWQRRDMQGEMVSPQAVSEPLFVTHDDDSFRTAVAREQEAEIAHQLVPAIKAKPAAGQLRRALALEGAARFEIIQRSDAPSSALSALALDGVSDGNGRQP